MPPPELSGGRIPSGKLSELNPPPGKPAPWGGLRVRRPLRPCTAHRFHKSSHIAAGQVHGLDGLRLLSLADSGELPLSLQPVAACALLERVVAHHAVAAGQRQIELHIEAKDDRYLVDVDVERMSQVLDNLIQNAFRYTPAGGCVLLSSQAMDGHVILKVKDTGNGISLEDLPHIFDRFYRGDKSRQANGKSGLGLAIAKSIVEAHGGTIGVESLPGQGAEFSITLDAIQPQ